MELLLVIVAGARESLALSKRYTRAGVSVDLSTTLIGNTF